MTPTRCRPLLVALGLLMAMPVVPALAQSALPSLGESASGDFGIGDERRVGQQIMREIRRDPQYLDDPVLLDYVESIWQPLVAVARRLGNIDSETDTAFAWDVFLVNDRTVNAFALPGGHVGVHLGLIALTTSTDELASVLAHEMSHVTQRHIARNIGSSQRSSVVGLAAILLGVLAASRASSTDAAQAAIFGGQAAMVQGQLNFSRDMEREADRIGFGVLQGAGFSPRGMASMFEKLEFANRLNDNGSFPYLRSHPLTTERIGEARSRVADNAGPVAPTLLHALMRSRARVLMDSSEPSLRRLLDAADAGPGVEPLSLAYAQALAAAQLRDLPAARRAVDRALAAAAAQSDESARRAVQRLAAEVLARIGDLDRAQAVMIGTGPSGARPDVLMRAELALQARQRGAPESGSALRRSAEDLQAWTTERPDDALAWSLLSRAAAAAGQPLRSLRAGAEAQAAAGDLMGAIERFRSAQRGAAATAGPEMIELQVIDARLRSLQSQVRELRAASGSPAGP
jgi:predicted Zn-dependent protease